MKENYAAMPPEERKKAYRSLQRRLILPNLLVLLLALVAAASLVFCNTLEIRLQIGPEFAEILIDGASSGGESAAAARSSVTDEELSGSETQAPDGETGESSGYDEETLRFLLRDVHMTLQMQLTPAALREAAFAEDGYAALRALFTDMAGEALNSLQGVFEQMAPALLAVTVVQQSSGENIDYGSVDTSGFAQTIALLNEQDPDAARAAFLQASAEFAQEQLGETLTPEQQNAVSEQFDSFVTQITGEDGTIDFANLASSSGEENIFASVADVDAMVNAMAAGTVTMTFMAVRILAAIVYGSAALWALLAVFALLHILLPNKKLGMWYVKLTGFLPCLLFFVLPLAATALLPRFVADIPATLTGLFGFSSLTFISGICYLALWALSVFVCHPIKKRIRACKSAL